MTTGVATGIIVATPDIVCIMTSRIMATTSHITTGHIIIGLAQGCISASIDVAAVDEGPDGCNAMRAQ
jgi:hypothetical protein